MFERLKLAWRPDRQDVETFRLVKFFSFTGFMVILIFTLLLTLLLVYRAQKLALKKSQDYALLVAANLNHQVFQQFVLPVAIRYQGKIQIKDPEQFERLDAVVRHTIHGFHIKQVNIYDQVGTLSYSTDDIPLGEDCYDVPEVKKALLGEPSLIAPNSLLDLLLFHLTAPQQLKTYIPFRLERKLTPELGPVIGVFEITQDISQDLAEIGWFQLFIITTLVVIMGLLFLILRQIVKKAEIILERRHEEQKALLAQLNQAEKLAALGEMIAGVAHEIRNPLGIISSTAELLRQRLAKYEPQDRLAQIIVEESNRLNQTVTEFLDFARPREPNLRPCNPEEILERNLELLQPEIEKHHITVDRHYSLDGHPLTADPDLLYRAFLNILLNAIQALPEGGKITVTTRFGPHNEGALIQVQDNGEGIEAEAISKIFNPFFTTKDMGSGLGLSIVKSIIESHRGTIDIDSTPGQGTTVIIMLPDAE
ncbi:MAG: two-component sensor histidine kinase [Deltaproteobacteria bacterium]|nr:two-component sensor histidine kinase [Deltaproteobacteria bacterium]